MSCLRKKNSFGRIRSRCSSSNFERSSGNKLRPQPGALGFIRVIVVVVVVVVLLLLLGTTSSGFTEIKGDSPRFTKIHQDSPRFTKIHQDSPGFTKIHQDSPRFTKIHQDSPRFTGIHRDYRSPTKRRVVYKIKGVHRRNSVQSSKSSKRSTAGAFEGFSFLCQSQGCSFSEKLRGGGYLLYNLFIGFLSNLEK